MYINVVRACTYERCRERINDECSYFVDAGTAPRYTIRIPYSFVLLWSFFFYFFLYFFFFCYPLTVQVNGNRTKLYNVYIYKEVYIYTYTR